MKERSQQWKVVSWRRRGNVWSVMGTHQQTLLLPKHHLLVQQVLSATLLLLSVRCSTERFAHCASTLMTVNIKFCCCRARYKEILSKASVSKRLAALGQALVRYGIHPIVPPKKYVSDAPPGPVASNRNKSEGKLHRNKRAKKVRLSHRPFDDMRRTLSRAVYKCAIPYIHLISAEDLQLHESCPDDKTSQLSDADERKEALECQLGIAIGFLLLVTTPRYSPQVAAEHAPGSEKVRIELTVAEW